MKQMDHMQVCDVAEVSLLQTDAWKASAVRETSFVPKRRMAAAAKPKSTKSKPTPEAT